MTDPIVALPTRFEAAVVPANLLEQMQAVSNATSRIIVQVAQDYQVRRLGYHGSVLNEVQYDGELSFSDNDGQSFATVLATPEGNRVLQLRCSIRQLGGDELIRGLQLLWTLPAGWVFTDGISTRTYEEFVSNPVVIARTMRSPANPQPAAWKVDVERWFT